jgi:hypothetical protein
MNRLNQNMINKINKKRRRSMNATPTLPSKKNQWQGAQADPKQKQDRAKTEHGQVKQTEPENCRLGLIESVH